MRRVLSKVATPITLNWPGDPRQSQLVTHSTCLLSAQFTPRCRHEILPPRTVPSRLWEMGGDVQAVATRPDERSGQR